MKVKIGVFLAFLFFACPDGFCQDLQGKRDGIHREFYANERLKLEYMVKDEKLNGFYEKYDENGALEYREYYIDGVYDGTDRSHYYFTLFFWYQHIGEEAQEVFLTDEEAVGKFREDYELASMPIEGNWMGIVRTRIPVGETSKDKHPVTLAGISKNYLYLKEYRDRENVEPMKHYFYDLIRRYKVERSYDVDALFNASFIEQVFQRRHTGVEYGAPFGDRKKREGSRLSSAQQYIGEPDYAYPLKPSGWFDVYYEAEDLRILGHSSAVYFMEEGRPEWATSPEYLYKKRSRFDREIKRLMEDQK